MIRFLVNVPNSLHDALKVRSMARGTTLNALVREILWDWIERNTPVDGSIREGRRQ